jgi:hypothetical protein
MVYSSPLGRLAQRESAAFTRQRSLVRAQHRPLWKSIVLQLKPRDAEPIGAAPSTHLTTVKIPTGESALYRTHLRHDERRWGRRDRGGLLRIPSRAVPTPSDLDCPITLLLHTQVNRGDRLDPTPDLCFVAQVLFAELALQIALLALDHAALDR